jgi:anti-anti-sigma regulatory factor
MGVILNFHVSSARKNQRMIVAATNTRVHSLFELTKVDKILMLAPTVEAAESLV